MYRVIQMRCCYRESEPMRLTLISCGTTQKANAKDIGLYAPCTLECDANMQLRLSGEELGQLDAGVDDARRLNEAIVYDLKLFDWMGMFCHIPGSHFRLEVVWNVVAKADCLGSNNAICKRQSLMGTAQFLPRGTYSTKAFDPRATSGSGKGWPISTAFISSSRRYPFTPDFGWIYMWASPPEHFFMCQE
jgi:hypothetical protein